MTALLASHLAAGGLFLCAALALTNKLPPSFMRFCTAYAGAIGFAAGLFESGAAQWIWFGFALVSATWYFALRRGGGRGKLAPAVAALAAATAPILHSLLSSETSHGLAVAGAISSSLLLGAVTVTMVLGHWYLVDTSLSIAPLKDGARWFSIAVALRWLCVLVVLAFGGWEVLRITRAADLILSTNGMFFLFRSLMGLAAPLMLSVLIWQTVKMRSTQSATGLLYVAMILILFGELVSQFLLVRTGFPL